jgi:hypothetical protein
MTSTSVFDSHHTCLHLSSYRLMDNLIRAIIVDLAHTGYFPMYFPTGPRSTRGHRIGYSSDMASVILVHRPAARTASIVGTRDRRLSAVTSDGPRARSVQHGSPRVPARLLLSSVLVSEPISHGNHNYLTNIGRSSSSSLNLDQLPLAASLPPRFLGHV